MGRRLRLAMVAIGLGMRTRPSSDCSTSRAGALSQRGTVVGSTCTGSKVTGRS